MTNGYKFEMNDCDVADKVSLAVYRQKREQWLNWLKTDEHHAICSVIWSMAWNDVVFRLFARIADIDGKSALHDQLLTEALVEGHFAVQILAIRRLMDKRPDVVSLRRLLDDLGANIHLFTRENYVSHDGLPFDHQAAEQRVWATRSGRGPFWGAKTGPDACWPSKLAHETFDKLTGIDPACRNRNDRIPETVIQKLRSWLDLSEVDQLVTWSHKFLAHGADADSRQRINLATAQPNLAKITKAIRYFARISEAVLACMLFEGGHGNIVPTAQFDKYERLNSPVLAQSTYGELEDFWQTLADDRDNYLEGVLDELIAQPC